MLHWPDPDLPPINLINAPHQDVTSPCVSRCHIQQDICTGCGRTLAEVASWSTMTLTQRQAVVDRLRSPHARHPD